MVRSASLALFGVLLATPAVAAPNVFWTFGFHFPVAGREPGGFGQAAPSDRLIQLALASDRLPALAMAPADAAVLPAAAPTQVAVLDLAPALNRPFRQR